MIAVLLWHAETPYFPGGYVMLDLFFVMSGFLITGLLVREIETTGALRLGRFFARRIRRLLPSVVVVLAFVLAASAALMAPVFRPAVAADVVYANLYVVNWRFADQQLDYLGRAGAESPVLHFWSLSVEEQFYIFWPALLLLVVWWWRRSPGAGVRARAAIPIGLVGAASLAYSIHYSNEAAAAAYFSTFTRVWEFALGAGLALIPFAALRMPARVAAALAWAGLAGLAWACATYDQHTVFPGAAALLPALATVAIFAAGAWHPSILPIRLLSLAPNRWAGRISYSWYLWHWPLLVFAGVAWGPLSTPEKLAVVTASVVPTLIAYRYVEEPFRRSAKLGRSPVRTFQFGAATTGLVAAAAAVVWATVPTIPLLGPGQAQGAQALRSTTELQRAASALRPNPRTAVRDRGKADADGCLVKVLDRRSGACVYGVPASSYTVVLFGDSHAMQWFPAISTTAIRRRWRLVVLTKSACTPADVAVYNNFLKRGYAECRSWRAAALRRIARERPKRVIVSSGAQYRVISGRRRLGERRSARALEAGYVRTIRRMRRIGARVSVLRDTPDPPNDPRACVSRSPERLERCAFSRKRAYGYPRVGVRAAGRVPGTRLIDSRPVFCPRARCPAVIGDVLIYRNSGHITGTYMRTLRPWLARRL